MAIDMDAIRNKLNKLTNTQKKTDLLWKPTPGTHQIRIVPYKYNLDNPFIELYFHYNINNKTYLSPISFGDRDPINEFADKLKQMGTKEDWRAGKNMEPKLRTFVPVIVRGQENEGVKFWGFGKTVYQDLLAYIADPDYGDISDPVKGRDIVVEYTSTKDTGRDYPTTGIRVKPNESKIVEDIDLAKKLMQEQSKITDVYSVLTYDELEKVLQNWLSDDTSDDEEQSVSQQTLNTTDDTDDSDSDPNPPMAKSSPAPKPTSNKLDEVDEAFSKLFDK